MATFRHESYMPVSADTLYAWHNRPGAFERLSPPWQEVSVDGPMTGIADGVCKTLRLGPTGLPWVARHQDFIPGRQFVDVQVSGPFARWVHTHRFEREGATGVRLIDDLEFAGPLGPLSFPLHEWMLARMLPRMFRYRHARTARDLARQALFAGEGALRIGVTGASGLVGTALCAYLSTAGHEIVRLVRRSPTPGSTEVSWDPDRGTIDAAGLEGLDAVIHLAGENIGAGRWTPERKAAVLKSREAGTRLLATTLAGLARPPRVFISASGAGYYGDRDETPIDESAPSGSGFLAEVCRAWEAATEPARAAGIRVVTMRTGVVLTPRGGALEKMLTPFKLGLGGPIGHGRQGMSWIGLDDLVGAYVHVLFTPSLSGPVNAVAPGAVSSAEFARVLGGVLRRPAIFPLPAPVVTAMFGEMGRSLLLEGAFIEPRRLLESGFGFLEPELSGAMAWELGVEPTGGWQSLTPALG